MTLLDRRRARARDARTAYAITDRRVLALAGPYTAEVALGPGVSAEVKARRCDHRGPRAGDLRSTGLTTRTRRATS